MSAAPKAATVLLALAADAPTADGVMPQSFLEKLMAPQIVDHALQVRAARAAVAADDAAEAARFVREYGPAEAEVIAAEAANTAWLAEGEKLTARRGLAYQRAESIQRAWLRRHDANTRALRAALTPELVALGRRISRLVDLSARHQLPAGWHVRAHTGWHAAFEVAAQALDLLTLVAEPTQKQLDHVAGLIDAAEPAAWASAHPDIVAPYITDPDERAEASRRAVAAGI